MSHPRHLLPTTALLALLAGASAAAGAAPQQSQRKPHQAQQDDQSQSKPARGYRGQRGHDALSESIRRAERETHGQVLSAERVPYDGRSINRIKVVDGSGRVRIYMDDPRQRTQKGNGRSTGGRQRRGSASSTHDDDD